MKTALMVILSMAVVIGIGFFSLPILIDKETHGLRSEVQALEQRLQKIEDFMKSEEAASKAAQLSPDANVQKIIKTINTVSSRVTSLEDSFKKNISATEEVIKKQQATTEAAFKKQAETIDKIGKDVGTKIQRSMFNALMASIRGHVLKVKIELVSKNIGTAKNELELISEAFEKAKTSATDEDKKVIEELQGLLKKARAEVDSDLPSATNRVDLLWHELGKLLRKV
ncbi:MAG: hypothetical protein D4R73_11705 [Deltaproteobacteria bacterium]|nr:MAG: hypothetical protein D4R73_11705 [Deltaproteobacteria bacterium]